ncbi:hypothetical protein DWF00_22995 [Bosea caraganae]|uniref:DUF945 family protein n=1 Tax=Bosea caraganae TaxID=2763117 RepID=A0A370L1S7_9HYPH|nr:hypothetical protein [Bosea caraganae]RDJ21519.1 hypothetical protein DWE98_21060 [Bosea caraganae]RDJ23487.1 hypothetical protein DWF00_22995 [Bosea caraganae]
MIAPLEATVAWLRRAAPAALLLVGLAASPAGAGDFEVENLTLDFGAYKVTAPKLQVKGSPLEREAFVALFDKSAGESGSARMARLNVDEISAPELTIEQILGTETESTTYRAIVLSDIRDGKVARGETTGGTMTGSDPIRGEYKAISAEGLDLRQIIRVLAERAAPGAEEKALPLYSLMTYEGGTLEQSGSVKASYGKASDRNLKGKAGPASLTELLTTILREGQEKVAGADKDDDAQQEADKRVAQAMIALTEMLEFGSGELRDLVIEGTMPLPMSLRIARIAYGENASPQGGMAVEGTEFGMGGEKKLAMVKLDSLKAFDFAVGPALRELIGEYAKPDDEAFEDWRKLMPKLGTLQIAGFTYDMPFQTGFSIGSLEAKVSNQFEGLPTDLSIAIETLKLPLSGPLLLYTNALSGLGYQEVNLSARLDLAWQEATSEIALRSLSLDGAGIGRLSASATLGNIGKDVFSSDLAVMQIAALGATAKALDVRLENAGLAERLVEEQAKQKKRKPADVQREYGALAKIMLSGLLGKSADAKALVDAAARFVAKPGVMTVQAKAKASSGLGLADVIAVTDPAEVFKKIDVTANAE